MPIAEPLFAEFPPVSTEAWEEAIARDLKGADPAKLLWKTEDGFECKPFYRAGETPLLTLPAKPAGWEIRARIPARDFAAAATQVREAVERGAQGLSFPRLELDTAAQLTQLLEGVPEAVTLDLPAPLLPLLAEAKPVNRRNGCLHHDPLADLAIQGSLFDSAEGLWSHAANYFREARRLAPGFAPLIVRATVLEASGATIVQQLGCALAAAADYFVHFAEHGIEPVEAARHTRLSFAVGSSYFLEIAKLRAARLLFARLLEGFGVAGDVPARIDARTSTWNLTLYDAHNNLLRGTTESMAAVLGGCDALVTGLFSELPRYQELARRMALNTQLLLRDEAYFDKVADPAAGSWYIENLTDSVARHAWALFQEIEAQGGYLAALQSGAVQGKIAAVRSARDKAIAGRRRTIVGINQYPDPKQQLLAELLAPAPAASSGPAAAGPSTPAPAAAAEASEPGLSIAPLPIVRAAAAFENLRLITEKSGRKVRVALLTEGDAKMRRARAGFAHGFFACAGFETFETSTLEGASPCDLIVLCSSDEEYPAMAERVCRFAAAPVVVAGFPKDSLEALKSSGVVDFIHIRSDAVETLSRWQKTLGLVN